MKKLMKKLVDNPKVKTKVLTGAGLALTGTTVYLVAKQTPKISVMMEDRRNELEVEELNKIEEIKVRMKGYALPIATGIAAGACFVLSDYISGVRLAKAVSAGMAAEKALIDYQMKPGFIDKAEDILVDQTTESIKEKRERRKKSIEVNDELKTKVKENPNLILTWVDCQSNQTFKASYFDIVDAIQNINDKLMQGDHVTQNDIYDFINESIGSESLNYIDGGYERGIDYRFDGMMERNFITNIDYDGKFVEKGEVYTLLKYEVNPLCSNC